MCDVQYRIIGIGKFSGPSAIHKIHAKSLVSLNLNVLKCLYSSVCWMCTGTPKTSQGKHLDFQIPMNVTRVGTILTLYPNLPPCKHCPFFLGLSLGTQRTSPGPRDRRFEDKSYVPLSLRFSLWNIFTPGPLEGYLWMLLCLGCLLPLGANLLLKGEHPSLSPSLRIDGN